MKVGELLIGSIGSLYRSNRERNNRAINPANAQLNLSINTSLTNIDSLPKFLFLKIETEYIKFYQFIDGRRISSSFPRMQAAAFVVRFYDDVIILKVRSWDPVDVLRLREGALMVVSSLVVTRLVLSGP